jgi:multidrug/hemolysin transport system ATP-binding protein
VWQTLHHLRDNLGLTIFLTTHDMEEAERADQVTIIDHGKIIATGTPASLRAAHAHPRMKLSGSPELDSHLTRRGFEASTTGHRLEITIDSSAEARHIICTLGDLITDFEVIHGTMNDVFLELSGTTLRED